MANFTSVSRGRRLLLAVLQLTTGRDVAARCGVRQQRVSEWVNGLSRPSDSARLLLERNYRIPFDAWDTPYISGFGDTVNRPKLR